MRTSYILIPLFSAVLLGAGCALTQSQSDQITRETPSPTIPVPEPVQVTDMKTEAAPPAETPAVPEPAPPVPPVPAPRVVNMKVGDFFFNPSSISAKPGEALSIVFSDASGHHDFVIDELNIRSPITQGGSVAVTAPTTPGRYAYYCSIGAHRTLGMEGTLVVE